jgi:hypothetical protein
MTLSLSMSLSPGRRTLPQTTGQTTGPLAAEGWVLVPDGQDRFEISAAQPNGAAPALSLPDSDLIRIGTATGWSLASTMPGRLRILQALSNSPAPSLSTTGSDLILIGA